MFAHGQLAFETLLQFVQSSYHLMHQAVHAVALLHQHELVRALLLFRKAGHFFHIVFHFTNLIQDFVAHLFRWICGEDILVAGSLPWSLFRLNGLKQLEDTLTHLGTEVDFCIGMHPEEQGRLRGHRLDVFQVLLVRSRARGFPAEPIRIRHQFHLVQDFVLHEVTQVFLTHSSIPVIHNVASIHDLTENVAQIFPWDFHRSGSLQVIVQHRR
mmetsp:Transcript_39708/g.62380  ORF Transcript_39708/g.62380 Transcript_39708/m.62380 type:complete len:213 (+) Transcript_39708:655-1293(+)